MERYFIELTESNRDTVTTLERYNASTEVQAVEIFGKLIKKARAEKTGDGARILYGLNYEYSEIVETWAKW